MVAPSPSAQLIPLVISSVVEKSHARTHQSPRFLTSISQILVIFEPDSNLDAENPQKSIFDLARWHVGTFRINDFRGKTLIKES